jgi:ariadne-1
MEAFVCDAPSLLGAAGITAWETTTDIEGRGGVALPAFETATLECRICCDNVHGNTGVAAPCGHFFCSECYSMYLRHAVDEGTNSVRMACPEDKCSTLVPPSLIKRWLGDANRVLKYEEYCLSHFVSFSKELRY